MVSSNLDNCHSLPKRYMEFFFEDSQWSSVYAFETSWVFLGLEGKGQKRETYFLQVMVGRLLDVAVTDIGWFFLMC